MNQNLLISTCSAESAVSASPSKRKGLKQSGSARSTPTLPPCSESTGRTSPIMETCEMQLGVGIATLLPGASPASLFPQRDSTSARSMTVTSGRQCWMSSRVEGRLGCLVKMCLESLEWTSATCLPIWKKKVISHKRSLFQLVPLEPFICGIGSGLLPTPKASDMYRIRFTKAQTLKSTYGNHVNSLNYWLIKTFGMSQNPAISEVLMGLPKHWTKCDFTPSEIQSFRKSRKSSQKQSAS